jgi:hypothetical protein
VPPLRFHSIWKPGPSSGSIPVHENMWSVFGEQKGLQQVEEG